MSINDLMNSSAAYNNIILIFCLAIPILALSVNLISGKSGTDNPWKYIYSVLIYLTAVPGIFCFVIIGYTALFLRQNLLMLNIVTNYIPFISMIFTLVIIRKNVSFAEIPGFKRLAGLMLIIGMTFVSVIIIDKMRLFVISSIWSFIILCVVILMSFCWDKLSRLFY